MKSDQRKSKKKVSEKQYLIGQHIGNLIGVLFVAPGLAYLTFVTFGNGPGDLFTVQAFVALDIFFFMIIQTWGAVANTRKDFLHGKWVMESEASAGAADSFISNPSRIALPPALIAGAIAAAILVLAAPHLGQEPFHFLNVGLMAGLPLFAVSSVLISRLVSRDQVAFAASIARSRGALVPFRRYLVVEHILPWVLIQGGINLAIGLKQFFNEAAKHGGEIPAYMVAIDFGIVSVIIVFFMWLSSMTQVRPDVRLGRVAQNEGKAPIIPVMLLVILSFLIFGALIFGVFLLFGIETLAPLPAALAKALVAAAMVIPGCSLGVWWGRRRETAMMKELEEGDNDAMEEMTA